MIWQCRRQPRLGARAAAPARQRGHGLRPAQPRGRDARLWLLRSRRAGGRDAHALALAAALAWAFALFPSNAPWWSRLHAVGPGQRALVAEDRSGVALLRLTGRAEEDLFASREERLAEAYRQQNRKAAFEAPEGDTIAAE